MGTVRSDAAQIYERWWPVALRYASRWVASPADAEDVAAAALVAFIEEAPRGLGDRAVERALARHIARSREWHRRGRRSGLLVVVEPQPERDPADERDGATWERVRRALAPADLAAFELADRQPAPGAEARRTPPTGLARSGTVRPHSRTALASRRWRARHRAAAAALAVDDEGGGPTCALFSAAIPAVARKSATAEQRRALIEHTIGCDRCDRLLTDRRAVARRWRIAGVVPGLFALRRFRRLGALGSGHPLATGAAVIGLGAVVAASAVVVPVVTAQPGPRASDASSRRVLPPSIALPQTPSPPPSPPPSPAHPPPPTTTTTTSTAPGSKTTTTGGPVQASMPASTTTPAAPTASATSAPTSTSTPPPTPVTWALQLQGLATPAPGGSVTVSVVAESTRDGAAAATDLLTFSSGCGSAQATTGSDGTASAQLLCLPGDFPLTVTATDAAGASAAVVVGSP